MATTRDERSDPDSDSNHGLTPTPDSTPSAEQETTPSAEQETTPSAEQETTPSAEPNRGAIEVLYRDESAIAVCKPGGMLVHRTKESAADSVFLLQEVRDMVGKYVYPVHRLDRPASGVLLFALSSEDTALWQEAMAAEETEKDYIAMVRGHAPDAWCMDRPLTSDAGVRRAARTTFFRILGFAGFSLVRARLHSGRRHQIRRHLAHSAHQIVGDSTYGKGRINQYLREEHGLPRLFLHATSLRIHHPWHGEEIVIRSPLPDDLRGFLERYPEFPNDRLAEL